MIVLGALVFLVGGLAGLGFADERAERGIVVSSGGGSAGLLLRNDAGLRLVVVDLLAIARTANDAPISIGGIEPGDRIDYAVSTWAGMDIVELLSVTPLRIRASE
jgi:hypothetical protein